MKKIIVCTVALLALLVLFSCGEKKPKSDMPEDFSFSIAWSVDASSSYDSKSGKLVKTTNATTPEDYVTTLILSEDELIAVWNIIKELDMASYPAEFSPYDGHGYDPGADLLLSVSYGDTVMQINCYNVSPMKPEAYEMTEEAERFMNAFNAIRDMLTESEEWKALPEYEFYYA